MSHLDTVGGQTLISGETVLVLPSGEVVGSTTPDIFERGSRRGRGGGRRRVQTDAPSDIISPIEVQPSQAEPRSSFSQRFFSAVPTFGQQTDPIIRSDVASFERIPEEERLQAAREGRFGARLVPAGLLERQLGLAGTVTFERRPKLGRQAGRTLREEGIPGLVRRGAGSVFLGTSRTVLGGGQELFVSGITGGLPTQPRPDLEFAGSIRRQPGDVIQTGAAIGAIAIPVGFGALRFGRVARRGGLRAALSETTEAIAPVKIPSGVRFVPRSQIEGENIFGFREGRTLTGVGVTPSGAITRTFRGDIGKLAGGEETFTGTQFVRGTEVTIRGGRPTFREGIARVPVDRSLIIPAQVEVPITRGVGFGGRGFISEEFAGLPLARDTSRVFGFAGRRVRPETGFSEAGFIPESRFVVTRIEPTFRGTRVTVGAPRRRGTGLRQEFALDTTQIPAPPRQFAITRPSTVQQGLPLIGAGAFPQLLRQPSAFAGTGQFERTAGGLRPPRVVAATIQTRRLETAIPLGRGLTTLATPQIARVRIGGIPAFRQPLAQAQPLRQRIAAPTPTPTLFTGFDFPAFGFPIALPRLRFRRARFGIGGILPGFGAGGGVGLTITAKQRKKRQPSFAALFFDISAPEPARFERTGLVLRPIIR